MSKAAEENRLFRQTKSSSTYDVAPSPGSDPLSQLSGAERNHRWARIKGGVVVELRDSLDEFDSHEGSFVALGKPMSAEEHHVLARTLGFSEG